MKNIFRRIISFSLILALLFENNSLNVLAAGNNGDYRIFGYKDAEGKFIFDLFGKGLH